MCSGGSWLPMLCALLTRTPKSNGQFCSRVPTGRLDKVMGRTDIIAPAFVSQSLVMQDFSMGISALKCLLFPLANLHLVFLS